MATINYRFLVRAYTTSEWESSNGILLERELGVELDDTTGLPIRCKFGNGSTPWNDLGYSVLGLGSVDLAALSDGDVLVWDAANQTWAPGAGANFPAVMARISLRV